MCGIYASLHCRDPNDNHPPPGLGGVLGSRISARGPDGEQAYEQRVIFPRSRIHGQESSLESVEVWLRASVLSLRGEEVTQQPMFNDTGVFCWNGEAWTVNGDAFGGNDGKHIFELMTLAPPVDIDGKASLEVQMQRQPHIHTRDHILSVLMSIRGPSAFVFFDPVGKTLYFGRDSIGRRSLLYKGTKDRFLLSSVSDGSEGWNEVDADGVYILDIDVFSQLTFSGANIHGSHAKFELINASYITHFPYSAYGKYPNIRRDFDLKEDDLGEGSLSVSQLEELLRAALKVRVDGIPHAKRNTTIDSALPYGSTTGAARLAILFSGGLDCTVLARLIHDYLPIEQSVDLLNVAFDNRQTFEDTEHSSNAEIYNACPDRITARASYSELLRECPRRAWRLVEINVSFKEAMSQRDEIIGLMYPHNTEMDLSIAYALYFAARGSGELYQARTEIQKELGITLAEVNDRQDELHDHRHKLYRSQARVLFSGLGADELFAGYQRHATAFTRHGFPALLDELELDINRLGKRNLGRDDRVISQWGKEVRYPYLDETVVRWAVESPVTWKCGFGRSKQPEDTAMNIEPGKKILRLLAHRLGLKHVAKEKKRAIQFGARTAKLERKTKGTTLISPKLDVGH